MAHFAIIENDVVTNVIVADNEEIALAVTDAHEVIETTGEPWIYWTRTNGIWEDPAEKQSEATA